MPQVDRCCHYLFCFPLNWERKKFICQKIIMFLLLSATKTVLFCLFCFDYAFLTRRFRFLISFSMLFAVQTMQKIKIKLKMFIFVQKTNYCTSWRFFLNNSRRHFIGFSFDPIKRLKCVMHEFSRIIISNANKKSLRIEQLFDNFCNSFSRVEFK